MIFSKSFGYTIRGILFISFMQKQKQFVQVEEIASALSVPRHFMGKILKKLAKEKILSSSKGPAGGFTVNENTLQVKLLDIVKLTDGSLSLGNCVLRLQQCSAAKPCPMHHKIEDLRKGLGAVLSETSIADLLNTNQSHILESLTYG